jgi:hypothetical protein
MTNRSIGDNASKKKFTPVTGFLGRNGSAFTQRQPSTTAWAAEAGDTAANLGRAVLNHFIQSI